MGEKTGSAYQQIPAATMETSLTFPPFSTYFHTISPALLLKIQSKQYRAHTE